MWSHFQVRAGILSREPRVDLGSEYGVTVSSPRINRKRMARGISVADMVSEYTRGWYKRSTSLMYLNRGVGFTFLPWRIHCPPEIALIQLSPGNKGAETSIPEGFLKYGYRRI
jgi:hypothetical protein